MSKKEKKKIIMKIIDKNMKQLLNKKIYVGEQSIKAQEKLLKWGFRWYGSIEPKIKQKDRAFIFLHKDKRISYSNYYETFKRHRYEEITIKELLEMEVEAEFKPFQKVLVRNTDSDDWTVDIYSHYYSDLDSYPHRCVGGWWAHCIPFEDNEHLLGQ